MLSGALAAAISGAVAACGAESSRPQASGPVTLSLWTHDQGYQKFFAGGIAAADRATPFDYRLRTMLAGPNDLVTKLLAQAVAGRGLPDLMGFERGSFPRMLRGDIAPRLLSDLRSAVATVPGLTDDLLTARTAPYTADGRLYALDSDTPLVVYHYRADLFARYGLPTDTTSWEELARIGEALHRRHGVSLGAVATGSNPGQVVQIFEILLEQRGGTFFDDRQRLVVDSPEAAEVLEFLCTGLRTGFLTSVDDFYGGPMQAALKGGRIIGLPMASWYKAVMLLPNLAEQSGRWRIRSCRPSRSSSCCASSCSTAFPPARSRAEAAAAPYRQKWRNTCTSLPSGCSSALLTTTSTSRTTGSRRTWT
ncbi:ABC transporter substrate-binding protein [Streptomyces milbemycinicus]|uniref:ABC transporter substrate-binding protein n=1 Tax=Streptomyces milbemycinicus TaxID=476552 RepID=A0ABW8M421_9ACTN